MIANPKKQIVVDYNITEVKEAILKISKLDKNYKLNNVNDVMKMITFSCSEFLSLGVYIDINYAFKSDTTTEICIEVRRKIGAFDESYEVSKADRHIQNILNTLTILLKNPVLEEKEEEKYIFFRITSSKKRVFAWIFAIMLLIMIPSATAPLVNIILFLILVNKTIREIISLIIKKNKE